MVDVASELKVLIVEGERGIGPMHGLRRVLDLALAPPRRPPGRRADDRRRRTDDSYVAPELISDLELGNKVLGDYRAIILAGVGADPAARRTSSSMFVEAAAAR